MSKALRCLFFLLTGISFAFGNQTNFAPVFVFGGGTEGNPRAEVLEGSDGLLYGLTSEERNPRGVLFKVNKNGTGYEILASFTDGIFETGGFDSSKLTEGGDEKIYVSSRRLGLLSINKDGTELFKLMEPQVSPDIVHANDGWIYGVGTNGMFKIRTNGTELSFITKTNSSERIYSYYGIIRGSDGYFYGGTGLSQSHAGIFRVLADGSGYEILCDFLELGEEGYARGFVEGSDGWLYGTLAPGPKSSGTVFKVAKDGTGFRTLHRFTGWPERWAAFQNTNNFDADGAVPCPKLAIGADGFLYGTTKFGGNFGGGTVFKISMSGTEYQVTRHFSSAANDGGHPEGGLIQGSDGKWYGTTTSGGGQNHGMVFRLDQDGGSFAIVKKFYLNGLTGVSPLGDLFQGRDGYIYGTTARGGSNDFGTVYRLNPDGTGHTILKSFSYSRQDGGVPLAGVIEGWDGCLYGTTSLGGSNLVGTIYKLKKDGSGFSILYDFKGGTKDGAKPAKRLVQASDGFLYGVTRAGGQYSSGIFYKVNTTGHYFVIATIDFNWSGGETFELVEAPGGALYGTRQNYDWGGTLFRVLSAGYSNVVDFPIGPDDYNLAVTIREGLSVGTNGFLYGAADKIYRFDSSSSQATVLTNSLYTTMSLTTANDGTLYGLQLHYDSSHMAIFKGYQDGSRFTILHAFDPSHSWPFTKLLLTRGGDLFGTFTYSGSFGEGLVYKLYAGPFPEIRLQAAEYSDGGTTLRFLGTAGRAFKVQATESLDKPIWHPVGAAVIGDNGIAEVTDEQAANYRVRFYRASQL